MIELIPPDKVLQKAISIVDHANCMMRVVQSLSEPPPSSEYLQKVEEKLKGGMVLKRLYCGQEDQYRQNNLLMDSHLSNYMCKIVDASFYQRMLIADEREMMFAVEMPDHPIVFYTKNLETIQKFTEYFDQVFVR